MGHMGNRNDTELTLSSVISGRELSISVHRLSHQQYDVGNGHRLSRAGCRIKPASAERSHEVAAARKQVNLPYNYCLHDVVTDPVNFTVCSFS